MKLLPGLILVLVSVLLTVVAGFYVGFNTQHDVTIKVMMSMFVFPTPYVLVTIAASILFHSKGWPPIAHTFNFSALILLCMWLINNIWLSDISTGWGVALDQSLLNNFYFSLAFSILAVVVMIVEGQIAWPGEKHSG